MGSPNASRYANIEGTGLASAGQQIASGAAGLSQAFQHAGAVRDQINAHLDSLNQKTGAYQLSMQGAARMKQDKEYVQEQLRTQGDKDPRTWLVPVRQKDGSFIDMSPDAAMQAMLRDTLDEFTESANIYGPEAVAQVAGSMSRDGQTAYSEYSDTHIKMKHDKIVGDYATVRDLMVQQGGDDTNPYRETVKLNLQDHIANAVKHGALTPTEGAKQQADTKADIAHKYWSSFAVRRPDQMLAIATERKGEGGGEVESGQFGKLSKLPEDLDPTKLDHYMALANGRKASQLAEIERLGKEQAARAETDSLVTSNQLMQKSSHGDASEEIELNRDVLGKRYPEVMRMNHEWNNARRTTITQATVDQSQFTQYDLMDLASRAKYDESLLSSTNKNGITFDVIRANVKAGKLLPEHAAPIMAKVSEAKEYHLREDPAKRQAEQDGFKVLDKIFFAPQMLLPQQAFELKSVEASTYNQLIAEYEKNPTADRNELAMNLQANVIPRVLQIQKASADSIEKQLNTMQESFPKGFASPTHELNEATRKQLEHNNPAMRGMFKVYDAYVHRLNEIQAPQIQEAAKAEQRQARAK